MGTTNYGVTDRDKAVYLKVGDRVFVRKPGAGNQWAAVKYVSTWQGFTTLVYVFEDGTEKVRKVRNSYVLNIRFAA